MNVEELIQELQKYPAKMEVVDYDGDSFDEIHYKRVYDSQYPHKEVEHIAVCLDFKNNYRKMDVAELKDILKCQVYDYPDMYSDNKELLEKVLNTPEKYDKFSAFTKWEYYKQNDYNKPIFKLIEFKHFGNIVFENLSNIIN